MFVLREGGGVKRSSFLYFRAFEVFELKFPLNLALKTPIFVAFDAQ
jgi:hypothetical protein